MNNKPPNIKDDFWASLTSKDATFPRECCVALTARNSDTFIAAHGFSETEVLAVSPENSAFNFNAASLAHVVEVANLDGVKQVTDVEIFRYEGSLTTVSVLRQL